MITYTMSDVESSSLLIHTDNEETTNLANAEFIEPLKVDNSGELEHGSVDRYLPMRKDHLLIHGESPDKTQRSRSAHNCLI